MVNSERPILCAYKPLNVRLLVVVNDKMQMSCAIMELVMECEAKHWSNSNITPEISGENVKVHAVICCHSRQSTLR